MPGLWRAALRLAWREVQASPRRWVLAVVAIAAGTSAVTAVHALSSEMRAKVRGEAREWIAADVLVQFRDPPSEDELARITGMDHTLVTGTFGMAGSSASADAVLAYVRVVDPHVYPLHGRIGLEPAVQFAELDGAALVASRDLLASLHVEPGGTVRLGKAEFRVAAAITHEPDWEVGVSTFLPHVLVSYAGYERAGIARAGVEADYRLLLRLRGIPLAAAKQQLAGLFPDCEQLDYRDPSPKAAAAFDAAAGFLWLAALLTLACGAMAVALILYLQVEHRLDAAAILKAVGARYRQVAAIYLAQASGLGLAGGVVAAATGPLVTMALAAAANAYLPLAMSGTWTVWLSLEAAVVGVLATLPATIVPLARIRAVSPLRVLRRHTEQAAGRGLRAWVRGPVAVRIAAGNLFRPGQHTGFLIAGLAAGVALVSATFLAQQRLSEQVAASVPASGANLYVIGASREQVEQASAWLVEQSAVQSPLRVFPLAWLRLRAVGGRAVDANRTAGEWLATCSDEVRAGEVALAADADVLGARSGDALEFTTRGHTIVARVAEARMSHMNQVVSALTLSCAALADVPLFYHGAVRVRPENEGELRRALARRFPSLPTLSRREFTEFVGNLAERTVAMMRIVCWQVVAIGLGLQMLLLAAARRLRMQETAVLKALGARPGQLAAAYAVECASIGALAGLAGAAAGMVVASLMLSVLLGTLVVAFSALVLAAALLSAMAAAGLAGWLACRQWLAVKPLEILRAE